MKKFIYTTIALVAVAAGCTKSNILDVPEVQKNPITFDTYNGRMPVTKASEITRDDISSICVSGFHVPANGTASYTTDYNMNRVVTRTKDGDSWSAWDYSPLMYWPASGSLQFVAYGSNTPRSESGEAGKLVPVDGSYVKFTYKVPKAASDQQDLIASPILSPNSGEVVTFNMKHLLSKVGFTVKTLGTGATVTIREISLHGKFVNNGTIDLVSEAKIVAPEVGKRTEDDYTLSYSLFNEAEYFVTTNDAQAGVGIYASQKTVGNEIVSSGVLETNRYMMLMPGMVEDNDQALNTGKASVDNAIGNKPYIKVRYELSGASEQTAYIALPDVTVKEEGGSDKTQNWTFMPGTAYEFIFEVSVAEIKFTGKVEPWNEDINDDGTVDEDDEVVL